MHNELILVNWLLWQRRDRGHGAARCVGKGHGSAEQRCQPASGFACAGNYCIFLFACVFEFSVTKNGLMNTNNIGLLPFFLKF